MICTRKKDIEFLIEKIKEASKLYKEKERQIRSDSDLTQEGKEKRCAEAKAVFERTCKMHLRSICSRISDARKRLEKERANIGVPKNEDMAHQLRLSNAIKTLELRGHTMSNEELVQLVEPLARDPLAESTIIAAAVAAGRDSQKTRAAISHLFANGNMRAKAIQKLQELENFFDNKLWKEFKGDITNFGAQCAVDMMLAYWNEDFTKYDE